MWNGFRGGKGVATSIGQCLATFPAYFPIDAFVGVATAAMPWWSKRAFSATIVSSVCWVGGGVVWWRARPSATPGGRRRRWPCPLRRRRAVRSSRNDSSRQSVPNGMTADPTSTDATTSPRPRRFGIVTDSNSQITADLVERFDVEVVPLTVTIDGADHLEGVDLDADGFYGHFSNGHAPEVSTSQPAPGGVRPGLPAARRPRLRRDRLDSSVVVDVGYRSDRRVGRPAGIGSRRRRRHHDCELRGRSVRLGRRRGGARAATPAPTRFVSSTTSRRGRGLPS